LRTIGNSARSWSLSGVGTRATSKRNGCWVGLSWSRGDLWGNALRFPVELDDLQTLPATSCGRYGGGGGRWRRERGCVLAGPALRKNRCANVVDVIFLGTTTACSTSAGVRCAPRVGKTTALVYSYLNVQLFSAKKHIVSWLITCRRPKSSYRAPNSPHSNKFCSKTIVFDHVFLHHF
jgi:hypothetical protein